MKDFVVGVDLGGTNVKTGLVTREGALIQHDTRPTQAEGGPEVVMAKMQEGVEAVLATQGIGKEHLLTVGIGAPGPMNWQTGIVYSPPNLPGWENVPLAEKMSARLGMPVYVDNDANVACYGEYWSGAAKDVQTMVLMTLGTGVGGGIVIDGKLLRGIDGTAAEIGHLQVQRDGRPHPFGFTGNLEAYASVTGLVRTAVEAIEAGRASVLTEMAKGDPAAISGKMISDAMRRGDEVATWAIKETAAWLGCATASLINLLNPEMVLFSGGMIAVGDVLFDTIRETAKKQSFEVPFNRAKIGPAALGENAGVIGAAGCALERYLAEHP